MLPSPLFPLWRPSSPSSSSLNSSPHPHTNRKVHTGNLQVWPLNNVKCFYKNVCERLMACFMWWRKMNKHRPFPIQQPQPLTFPPLPSCSLTLQGVTDFLFFFFCCMSSLALISFSSSRRGAWNSPSFRMSCRDRRNWLFSDPFDLKKKEKKNQNIWLNDWKQRHKY